jgi:ChrR Cupin-like domain
VTLKPLYRDRAGQRLTGLVRMEAGVRYRPHQHADTEELYLLEGDLMVEGQVLRPGDYCAAIGGTTDGAVYSEAGWTFIVVASERDAIIEDRAMEAAPEGFRFVRATEGAWRGVARRAP